MIFILSILTSDFQAVQIKSIINVFPDTNIILCWFHVLKNTKNKIPFLRLKNSYEKNLSKDLIRSIKIMFIPPNYIKEFYNDIKKEYNSKSYNKFYKYLIKFLFHEIGGKKYLWNFCKLIEDNNIPEGQYFVTNNFLERTNRNFNKNLIYKKFNFSF